MTAASSTERGRASVLRKRATLTPEERKWLTAYDAARKNTGRRVGMATPATSPAPSSSTSSTSSSTSTPAASVSNGRAGEADKPPPEVEVELDEDLDEPDVDEDDDDERAEVRDRNAPPTHLEPVCDIEDCSACRTSKGALVCKKTGRVAYPRLSEDGAEMLASVVMGGIHTAARTMRRDGRAPRPTPAEKVRGAKAIKLVADRRFPQAGAIDDLLVLAHVFGGYLTRSLSEPMPAKLPTSTSSSTSPAPDAPQPTQAPATAPPASSSTSARPASRPQPVDEDLDDQEQETADAEAQDARDFNEADILRELSRSGVRIPPGELN